MAAGGIWAACLVLGLFGTLIEVPEAIRDLSPFEAVPALPAESMHVVPVGVVAAVTVALVATGLATLRRATSVDGDRGRFSSATGPTLGSST